MSFWLIVLKVGMQVSFVGGVLSTLGIVMRLYGKHGAFREEVAPGRGVRGLLQLLGVIARKDLRDLPDHPEDGVLVFLWRMAGLSGDLLVLTALSYSLATALAH